MGPERLADVILYTLQFDAFLVALLFGAQGFSLGRLWPEGKTRPSIGSIIWFAPGFLLACYCLYYVADDYLRLTQAISRKEVLVFATQWMDNYWRFYLFLAAAALAAGLGMAKVHKP